MTEAQYESVKAILEADCDLQCKYVDEAGKTCAIGALALAAGVSPARFIGVNSLTIECLPDVRAKIQATFGLTFQKIADIQWANDSHDRVDSRRAKVLQVLGRGE